MSYQANGARIVEADDLVPILAPTTDILPRLKTLAAHFITKYNVEPSFIVRVPGRVNLIGEHIDYCGYSVCPMAIEQDILVAVTLSKDNEIHLTNVNSKYEDFRCNFGNTGSYISDSESGPAWYKYFLCGVKGALEIIPAESVPTGILIAVWGNILPNSGLSSSSALVSAALLSVVHANSRFILKSSKYTVFSQCCLFIRKGTAKLIEFNPLRATDVTLPENAVFVIAHSQAYHNKASTADYNLRVAECRFAAQIIAKKRNMDWEQVQRLIDIQERLALDLDEMVIVVMTELHEEPYTLDEICETLSTDYERLKKTSLVSSFNISQTFKLQQRALHVFQEADRVLAFRHINEEGSIMEHEKLQHLGNLMSKSHASLYKLYECSHPSVDALVERAIFCGAFGARLTGAGWGGCIVAIIDKNGVQQFVEALRAYLCQNSTKDQAELEDMVFPTSPNQGAIIYTASTLF
ncbi:GALK2 kinase, partial [Acromyrmex heyeri]